MAYLNEFPHTEASKLNLDWILEQYSTFNQRLQEIVQHFDESVAQMEGDILQFKGEYEQAFDEYKSQVNGMIESISDAIEQVSENVSEYVQEHMNEWQLEAMTNEDNNVIIGDYDPLQPTTDGGQINEIIINNVAYKTTPISGVRTIVFHTTLAQLNAVTSGTTSQTYTPSDMTGIYEMINNYFEKYETDELYAPFIATPELGETPDATTLNELYSGEFTPMNALHIFKVGSDIYINMPWARKSGVTFTASNGFYTNATMFLPN